VRWFNPVNGEWVDEEARDLKGGEETFAKPAGFADEVVLYLEAVGVPAVRRPPAAETKPSADDRNWASHR
jgi:hypothetical protein